MRNGASISSRRICFLVYPCSSCICRPATLRVHLIAATRPNPLHVARRPAPSAPTELTPDGGANAAAEEKRNRAGSARNAAERPMIPEVRVCRSECKTAESGGVDRHRQCYELSWSWTGRRDDRRGYVIVQCTFFWLRSRDSILAEIVNTYSLFGPTLPQHQEPVVSCGSQA